MNQKISGTFYGIGVGPGDPDLIPLKSIKILNTADVVFAAASTKNNHSQAIAIATPHIPEKADVRMLSFPMTKDRKTMEKAWENHARAIIAEVEKGKDAVFLTLGDSMTYATYGYVLRYVQKLAPHIRVVSVPGIAAYQAAAARVNTPLVEGEQALLILSGVKGGHRLRQQTVKPENVVFMKAYKNVGDIVDALDESDMIENSVGVANCGLENEEIIANVSEMAKRPPAYWTLIIAKQKL